MENFVVRPAQSLEDLQWIIHEADEEGLRPRADDAEAYFSANLTPYFYIGELDGQRIACVSVVKYADTFAFVGYYIVQKAFRGKGYGKKIFTKALAMASVGKECNTALDAMVNTVDKYAKSGFKRQWIDRRYDIVASNGVQVLMTTTLPNATKVIPASEIDFQKLLAYDKHVFGFQRQHLLASWIARNQESSWVAVNNDEVVGYLILRKGIQIDRDGYRASPLFSDSIAIARYLLKVACEYATSDDPKRIIIIDVPTDMNPEAVDLVEKELSGKKELDSVRMYTGEVTDCPWKKVYGVAHIEIG